MERQQIIILVDFLMGIAFLASLVTGLLKFPLLLQTTGLYRVVLPSALISDIHDWSGIALACLVLIHLYLNRRIIAAMVRKQFRRQT